MKIILILVPAATARGGITNYYQVLKKEFSENIEYFERGARTWPVRKGFISELIRAWKDYSVFKKRLEKNDIGLVQTTTSLGLSTTIRDGLFIRYAKKKNVKAVVFFRGWDDSDEEKVEKKFLWLFKYFFFQADGILTLSNRSKKNLLGWGYTNNIYLETTLFDKHLVSDVNQSSIKTKFDKLFDSKKLRLLYVSRIEKRKGIYELINAFKKINAATIEGYEVQLDICGDGFELEKIKELIQKEKISNIHVHGFVSGNEKKKIFEKAHIFVFPSYGEGMPNAVLEAMGFGIPILTTPVGGVNDFFIDGEHGYFIEIKSNSDIYIKIKLLLYGNKLLTIATNNYFIAKSKFRSDEVAKRVEDIFKKILEN